MTSRAWPAIRVLGWTAATGSLLLFGWVVVETLRLPSLDAVTPGYGRPLDNLPFVCLAGASVVGALLIARRRDPRYGTLWAGFGLAVAVHLTSSLVLATYGRPIPPTPLANLAGAWALIWPAFGLTLLLFPDGTPPSRRWRPLVPMVWVAAGLTAGSTVALPGSEPRYRFVLFPGVPRAVLDGLIGPFVILQLAGLLVCALSLVARYRAVGGEQRLQIRWVTGAGVLIVAGLVVSFFVESDLLSNLVLAVPTLAFFAAVVVAVLRYRLYDIDRLLSRALVVGGLGVFITGVYVAIVAGVGALVGQTHPSVALSVVATAVVAVAFQPVRERVQHWSRRLVYGERATPYEVLSDFATRLAGAYPTAELLPELARRLGQCLGGARVEVWSVDGGRDRREAVWPAATTATGEDGGRADRTVDVRHQDELLGRLLVTKRAGEPVTPPEDVLLGHVASQAGLVLRNVRLLDDLRGSRERLVAANDTARRRLERDLRDGARATLTQVGARLAGAAAYAGDDRDGVGPMVEEAAGQLRHATEELAELARGLHPAVLTEHGLDAALRSLADRSPIPVTTTVGTQDRFAEPVEVTVYFAAAEALTNVAKYAAASHVDLTLIVEDGTLVLTVTDDGHGGADPARGTGLRGLTDRVTAVDGTLDVHSPPGTGTRIICRVPATVAGPATVPVLEVVS